MRRRDFITGLSSVCWAAAARAEQSGPVRKVGLIMPSHAGDAQGQRQLKRFSSGLERLGWIDGRNISLFVRWSGGEPSLAKQFANELVRLGPELIVAGSTIGLDAARLATSKIPIVFVAVSDPVAAGYVESLAKPGGNITGFSSFDIETGGKWLEIIKDVVPTTSRVGVLMDPDYAGYKTRWRGIMELGPSFGVELSQVAIRAGEDIEDAISAFAKEPNGALIVFSSALTSANSGLIVNLANRYQLPTIYPFAFYVKQGGLISYGIDTADLFERSAAYVDRILKGTKPADLPIQRPTKFETFINLKTAKALGLRFPDKLLLTADEVIE
jgi:putative tryptophan/tyrosine transport system substrate-binding protein